MASKQDEMSIRRKPMLTQEPQQTTVRFLVKYLTPIIIACLLALLFRFFNASSEPHTVATFPVSLVLKQNLRLAKRSWEHGVLTHALLEFQNPELTVFAGPGYGSDLRGSADLQAFPGGKLPKCASEGGGSSWGRYDKWTNVKGLRYAAEKVDLEGRWLYNDGGCAADAASLGWATLLLERAGATDPMVPVEARRNLFGEAADRMVKWLFEENTRFVIGQDNGRNWDEHDQTIPLRRIGETSGRRWAISHQTESKQLWADSVFMVPPFLAAYGVAKQNETWLREAVEQIKAYREVLATHVLEGGEHKVTKGRLWKHIVSQPRLLGEGVCCHDEGFWLTGNAWALAGIVRVYGVVKRWDFPQDSIKSANTRLTHETLRQMQDSLAQAALEIIVALSSQERDEQGILHNYVQSTNLEPKISGDAAGTALVASSVYRSAQLGLLEADQKAMILWADNLYNSVVTKLNRQGLLEDVASVSSVPAGHTMSGTSEGQSFVLLMFAARRDCVKLKVCT